jgi:hypothetical protein
VQLGCLTRIALFSLGHSLMILSKAWSYKTKDCRFFLKEHGSLFSRLHCGMWLLIDGKWI